MRRIAAALMLLAAAAATSACGRKGDPATPAPEEQRQEQPTS